MSAPRYAIRPRAGYDDDHPLLEAKTIFESEPASTGLLAVNGHPIYRVKAPIGFVEHKTRD